MTTSELAFPVGVALGFVSNIGILEAGDIPNKWNNHLLSPRLYALSDFLFHAGSPFMGSWITQELTKTFLPPKEHGELVGGVFVGSYLGLLVHGILRKFDFLQSFSQVISR